LTQQFQSNLSFLNHLGLPDTLDNQTSVLILPQLHAHLGIFHIENEVSLFASDHQLPDYPTLSGKHTLYIEDKWFKNRMHLNLGFTVYWKNEHESSYYLPFVQSFIPADHMLPAEYRIHPFFAFRVRTFKFFVRMENSNLLWQKNKILFDNYHYPLMEDRKSTRLNSSHVKISYAVFCLKKKKKTICDNDTPDRFDREGHRVVDS